MKRYFTKILTILCLIIIFVLASCSGNEDELLIRKIEIHKVAFDLVETFDTEEMKSEKTWTFEDRKSIKVIANKSTIGNLEPRTVKPIDKEYTTYYVKLFHNDDSIEEWIFWLDKEFSKEGIAENKENKGIYKFLNKQDVDKIGQLLND